MKQETTSFKFDDPRFYEYRQQMTSMIPQYVECPQPKVVQISAGQYTQHGHYTLFALKGDGSIWKWVSGRIPYGMEEKTEGEWSKMPEVPE